MNGVTDVDVERFPFFFWKSRPVDWLGKAVLRSSNSHLSSEEGVEAVVNNAAPLEVDRCTIRRCRILKRCP